MVETRTAEEVARECLENGITGFKEPVSFDRIERGIAAALTAERERAEARVAELVADMERLHDSLNEAEAELAAEIASADARVAAARKVLAEELRAYIATQFESLPHYDPHTENNLDDKVEEGYGNALVNVLVKLRRLANSSPPVTQSPEGEGERVSDGEMYAIASGKGTPEYEADLAFAIAQAGGAGNIAATLASQPPSDGWRDMASAPRDGTEVQLECGGGWFTVRWTGTGWTLPSGYGLKGTPTKWRLPAPPERPLPALVEGE